MAKAKTKSLAASTDARWLARAGTNPACGAGRLPVNYDRLFAGTPYSLDPGQSPAAFATGNVFESVCEGPTGSWAPLREALAAIEIDLGTGGIETFPDTLPDVTRAARTRDRLERMLAGDRTVVLLTQAVLGFEFAGGICLIRPDAVAIVPVGDRLLVVELKGFRLRAGQFPRKKIAKALDQSAVYQVALRRIATELGYDPVVVAEQVVVVCARNTGMNPVAKEHNNADRRRTLETRLARTETRLFAGGGLHAAASALNGLDTSSDVDEKMEAFRQIELEHGTAYRPSCLAACGAARYCREQATDMPIRLGPTRLLGAAGTFRQADRFSHGEPTADPLLEPVAARLKGVRSLLDAARADADLDIPTPPRAVRPPRLRGKKAS